MKTRRTYKRKNGQHDREIHVFLPPALYKALYRVSVDTDLTRGQVLAAGVVLALEQSEQVLRATG